MVVDWQVWNRFFYHIVSVVILDQLEDPFGNLVILDQRSYLKAVGRIHVKIFYQDIGFTSICFLLAYDPDPKTKAFGIHLKIIIDSIWTYRPFK